jgi:hypothetical protein
MQFKKNIFKKALPVCGKAVLLHPLSERERQGKKGRGSGKFFESLRPAQENTSAAGCGARIRDPWETRGEYRSGTRDSE